MPGMASDGASAQTRSRISGLDSASECEVRIRRELISVSDLCGGMDEIQDLLDEITLMGEGGECIELERTGSRLTQETWDSHQQQVPPVMLTDPRTRGVVCGWQPRRLSSPLALAELALMLLSGVCLLAVGVSGDPVYGPPLHLPHAAHTRLAVFACVFCLLWTTLMLALQLTGLQYLLLINWTLMHTWLFCVVATVHAAAAVLLWHQSYLFSHLLPPMSHGSRTATTLAASCCSLAVLCALAVALLPRWLPAVGDSLIRDEPTQTTLVSNGDDWSYRHPEPEPFQNHSADSQHLPHNNPYIQWHVQNGTYYLLPAAVRQHLRRPSQVSEGQLMVIT